MLLKPPDCLGEWELTYPNPPTRAEGTGHLTTTRKRKRALFVGWKKTGEDTVTKPELACCWLIYLQNPLKKWIGASLLLAKWDMLLKEARFGTIKNQTIFIARSPYLQFFYSKQYT